MRNAVRPAAMAALLLVGSAGLALAHDFWLVPDAFRVAAGARIGVSGQTSSSFPSSEAAVVPERVAEARVLSASADDRVEHVSTAGTSLRLRHRPAGSGQRVIAVVLHPRTVRESPEGFTRYLELEGVPDALERYRREGLLPPPDSVTRRYAKYAKTFVEVGSGGPRAFSRAAGHPLEFVPLGDPAAARAGEPLAFRLLFQGMPLAGARLHAGRAEGGEDRELTTDSAGVAEIRPNAAGLWNVRTLQIVPAPEGSGADWDAHWATAVWSTGP